MSSVNAINTSVDNAVASVKQQILLAQQSADRQKQDLSSVKPTSSDVSVRPNLDTDHLGVEDLTEEELEKRMKTIEEDYGHILQEKSNGKTKK